MKSSIVYECTDCGSQSAKWQGQCGECGKWNTLVEAVASTKISSHKFSNSQIKSKLQKLSEIEVGEVARRKTGIGELDRVLGGGIVPGEVILMIGEPGIGKSTILTQLSLTMGKVVYVCGEESPGQVKLRVQRLQESQKFRSLPSKDRNSLSEMQMLPETDVDTIIATISQMKEPVPTMIIVDSVQTLYTTDLPGMSGSITQIRETTARLISYAKGNNVPVFLVGHVNKDGEMAGPKVLEHMVDAVLELSGDRYHELRLLRTQKNRFGPSDEVGVFQMAETGLLEVANPSEFFLAERQEGAVGSAVAVVMEGSRPVLLEVQALVVDSELPVPRRVAVGVDVRRVQILLGVLQKYTRLSIGTKDVFVKVTGGIAVGEPAIDLAVCLAVASSSLGKALPKNAVAIGEVGLLGEVRSVSWGAKRVKEAKKLGYEQIYSRDSYKKVSEIVKSL